MYLAITTMWDWIQTQLLEPFASLVVGGFAFLLTNLFTIIGFVLALVIIRRAFTEKRTPSNFFAWLLVVLFSPLIGVPLYFMFGGRKSRKNTRIKLEVAREAQALIDDEEGSACSTNIFACEGRGMVTLGNHVELLTDGETAFARLCTEIENAEHTIHIATYILSKDQTGEHIVNLLEKRASEGITVRLLLDSLGSWNQTRAARLKIRLAGGEVAMFMPVLPTQTHTSSNLRNHRKIAIFDNYRAITGGQNIDNRFLGAKPDPQRFADFSIVTQGPAVADLNRTFIADWAFAAKYPPSDFKELLQFRPEEAGNSTIEIIASGPDVHNDPLWEQILRVIQEFKQRLTIITPYFIPDEVIFRSLIVKAHTGRHIRLVLPLHSNQKLADIARHHSLKELKKAGVEILFYTPRMLHAKMILADSQLAMTGSANIDMRSLFVNYEIAQIHYSKQDIELLEQWSNNLMKDCITYDEALKDPTFMPSKFMQDLVQLIAPLL
ncbi:MAG TPA: cardiolipin synthase [Opitutae bacterium]|nr:cardiolipin synthase [Opitutae bacterium]